MALAILLAPVPLAPSLPAGPGQAFDSTQNSLVALGRVYDSLSEMKGDGVKTCKIAIIVGILLCLGAVSLRAQNASVRIGGSSLRANGQIAQGFQYSGPCPVDLKFGWGLIGSRPTTASYHFERSDGGRSSGAQSVNLPGTGHSVPVYNDWRLGANSPKFADFTGWVTIMIDYPSPVEGKIPFTLHCQ